MRAKKQVMPFYPITVTSAVYMDGTNKNFKDEYSETKSEIEQVRTATTGEKFNSVGERINTEINRLKKGYTDVNLIEQDSVESHSIQNTCEGSISDLIIRGKISNNLVTNGKGNFTIDKNTDPESRIQTFTVSSPLKKGNEYIGYIKTENTDIIIQKLIIYGHNDTTGIYGPMIKKVDGANIIKFSWIPNNGNIDYINTVGLYLQLDDFNNNVIINFSDFMLFEKESDPININEYFDGIKSFGQEESKINILCHGKNLFDGVYEEGKTINASGDIVNSSLDRLDSKTTKNFIKVIPNKKYALQGLVAPGYDTIAFYDINKNFINRVWQYLITVPSNCNYIKVTFKNNLQIEEGTQSTSYEAYKQDKKEILLPQLGFTEGLRGIRTAFDELNYVRDVAIKRIEKYIFNNKENIVTHEARENTIPFTLYFGGEFLRGKNNNINIICNCGIPITANCYSVDVEGIFGTSVGLYGAISKTRLETADEAGLIKFLRSVLKECYYELLTPIETSLEQHIELPSYDDATYVSFENNIVGTSSFKLPVDISKIIRSIIKENKMIENKVEKLSNEVDQIKTYMLQTLEEKNN